MTDVRARIAEALREHQQEFGGCCCGWRYHPNPTLANQDEHLADVLLALPGIAVVELPEPDSDSPYSWLDEDHRLTADEARALGAAVLAAVDAANAGTAVLAQIDGIDAHDQQEATGG